MRANASFWVVRTTLTLVALLPLAGWALRRSPGTVSLADALDTWFAFQCQRDPARSQRWLGEALPVCTRCLGIYLGLGLGAWLLRPALSTSLLRVWLLLAALFMGLDVLSEAAGMRPAWAPLRFLTGLCLSYPVGVALVSASRALGSRQLAESGRAQKP